MGQKKSTPPKTSAPATAPQPTAQQADAEPEQAEEPEQTVKGHLDAKELEGWSYNELKKLAAEMGVEVKGNKKADYIAAIAAEQVEASADDDELPPDLDVADPE